jgi:predicted hotdog family 3-hydroxylacyl-ACP dehydratase
MSAAELPPIEDLVPHRGESLLVDSVLEHDHESTLVCVVVGSQKFLEKADSTIAPWVAIEYMSQCIAAHESLLAEEGSGPPTPGFLTAAVGVRLHRSRFEAGERLRVRTRRARGRLGLGVFSHFCTVHEERDGMEGRLLVEGRLTIAVPRSEPTPRTTVENAV